MSSTDGDKETWMASTRVKDKPDPPPKYSFQWLKWMVDKLFPARAPNFAADRGIALRTRR